MSQNPSRKLHEIDALLIWVETDDGDDIFHHWAFFWSNGEDFFYSEYPERFLPEDKSALGLNAELIPRTSYEVTAPPNLLQAPTPQPEDSYIKRLRIQHYSPTKDGSKFAINLLIHEALVCDKLAKHPHPNICEYRGYVVNERGYMAGLCFKGYSKNLDQAIGDGDPVDSKAIVEGIRLGLKHMHSLGLVHVRIFLSSCVVSHLTSSFQNDVNPWNIMLASASWPVIIDFDSCQESGSTVKHKAGTDGWSEDSDLVVEENDWYGLKKIEAWLIEKTSSIHHELAETESN